MFIKNSVFSQFIATHPLHAEEQLMLARDPSVQSLLLVDHFVETIAAKCWRRRGPKI